jgi:hypothetical protein
VKKITLDGLQELNSGASKVGYEIQKDSLVIYIKKLKDAKDRFYSLIYLFGYNYQKPFCLLPKIRIATKNERAKIFDGKTKLDASGVNVALQGDQLVVRVPLELLGDPDFVLGAVRLYTNVEPFYYSGFRKINIK